MKRMYLLIALLTTALISRGDEVAITATDLAHKLSLLQQNGSSYVRLKMEIQPSPEAKKVVLQLQLKQRRTAAMTEIIYQVLWPKERNGEGVLVRKAANQAATCQVFTPPNTLRVLNAAEMKEGIFGGDLSYADVAENFFAWNQQSLVGAEVINRVNCQILESRAGKGEHANFPVVRTWVDVEHLVPMRVEKHLASGKVGLRIETTKTSKDEGQRVPANLTVQSTGEGSGTMLEGASIDHDVVYDDRTFTVEGLKDMKAPRAK